MKFGSIRSLPFLPIPIFAFNSLLEFYACLMMEKKESFSRWTTMGLAIGKKSNARIASSAQTIDINAKGKTNLLMNPQKRRGKLFLNFSDSFLFYVLNGSVYVLLHINTHFDFMTQNFFCVRNELCIFFFISITWLLSWK